MPKEPVDYSHEQEQALRDAIGDPLYDALEAEVNRRDRENDWGFWDKPSL